MKPLSIARAALLVAVTSAYATAAPALQSPSADLSGDSLLTDDLDGLLEGLSEPSEPPAPSPGSGPAGDDLGAKREDPFRKIASGMSTAERLIAERGQPAETSRVQDQVISDLDELIKQAEKQCSQCQNPGSGQSQSQSRQQSQRSQAQPQQQASKSKSQQQASQNRSRQAAKQSSNRLDAARSEAASTRPPGELMKEVWGRLPDRLREQMLESSSEEFLPEYREEIERYFRELAERPE